MGKGSGGTRVRQKNYYAESQRYKKEALLVAETLKGNPKRFSVQGISGTFELTKSDIKTIVSKSTQDNKFNALKNLVAKDIEGFLKKSKYTGWRKVVAGKHPEAEYFEYYDRSLHAKMYLCVRVMKGSGIKKPYAIIDQKTFDAEIGSLNKTKR